MSCSTRSHDADDNSESDTTHVATLHEDLRRLKNQLDDHLQTIKQHEATISNKQRDISILEAKSTASIKAKELVEQDKAALSVKIDTLQQDLRARDQERQQDAIARQKLEKELDNLRKVMADKTSEDSKRQEADRSRDAEMGRLRDQVVQLQKALDDHRDSAQQLANKLRVDVEGLKQNHTAVQKELKATQALVKEKEAALAQLQNAVALAENAKRQAEGDLAASRDKLASIEAKLQATSTARDVGDTLLNTYVRRFWLTV